MKINHNLSAVVANNRLHLNEDMVATSMERLSSGLSINHSKDNPAGMAISDRMTTQIDGLDQASQNAGDAGSLVQTADGALGEITEIIQRMRELSVQAASDTNTPDDKEQIQKEIVELKKEVDRMSRDTEFNTKGLLDGTLDNRIYCSKNTQNKEGIYVPDVDRIDVSDYVPAGVYRMLVKSGTPSTTTGQQSASTLINNSTAKISSAEAGTISVNGFSVTINEGDTYGSALQKFQHCAEKGETEMNMDGDHLSLKSTAYGATAKAEVRFSNPDLANLFGFSTAGNVKGTDAQVVMLSDAFSDGSGGEIRSSFEDTASVATNGNRVTITQPGGFSISFLLADNLQRMEGSGQIYDPVTGTDVSPEYPSPSQPITGYGNVITGTDDPQTNPVYIDSYLSANSTMVSVEVTTMGSLQVQIGANENQTTKVRIPKMDLENLYLDDLDVTTVTGADRAIASLDWALQRVNDTRSKIGAYENRLEHAVASLDQTGENLTAAFSRLRDVDMAEEMTKYTSANVLVQAATSVLAQANDLPEQALQLLQ